MNSFHLFVSDVNYLDNLIQLIETGNYIFHNGYDNIITYLIFSLYMIRLTKYK